MESDATATSYDGLASEYARRIGDELSGKPLDRALLRMVAEETDGLICDLGCGPGHVARFLSEAGGAVVGVDLSKGMVEQAKRLHPSIEFRTGNILSLPFPDAFFSAVVAFYSIIHLPPESLGPAFVRWRGCPSLAGNSWCPFTSATKFAISTSFGAARSIWTSGFSHWNL